MPEPQHTAVHLKPSSAGRRNRPSHIRQVAGYRVVIPEKDHGPTYCPTNVAWIVDSQCRISTMSRFEMARWLRDHRHAQS
jgi:hypothetical protein